MIADNGWGIGRWEVTKAWAVRMEISKGLGKIERGKGEKKDCKTKLRAEAQGREGPHHRVSFF